MKENVGALEIKLTDEQITDLNNKSKGLSYVLDGNPEENEL